MAHHMVCIETRKYFLIIIIGILDVTDQNEKVGDEELLKVINDRVRPLYHIFGHIHEGYGVEKKDGTTFINASICTEDYKPTQKPIVFELPVKEEGQEKKEA